MFNFTKNKVGLLEETKKHAELSVSSTRRAYETIFPEDDFNFVMGPWRTQGIFFAMDTMAVMGPELYDYPHGTELSYLDVGAGPGFGADLIGQLFNGKFASVHLRCSALELSERWERFYPYINENVSVSTTNLFDLPSKSYDIVTSSHVIEHMPPEEAARFIEKMRDVAREFAVVTCPWSEPEPRHPAHVHKIDESFIELVKPRRYEVLKSFGWNSDDKKARIAGLVFSPL